MSEERSDEIEGKMELGHEPVPPYKTVFFIAITIGVLYLGFILLKTLLNKESELKLAKVPKES